MLDSAGRCTLRSSDASLARQSPRIWLELECDNGEQSSQDPFACIHTGSGRVNGRHGHVTLTSRTWSSLLGMTRICMPVLELKTWPGGSACSRGIGKPLSSLLAAEYTLPLLLTLPLSSWSSTCLSTDRLSFSIQLSAKHTRSEI